MFVDMVALAVVIYNIGFNHGCGYVFSCCGGIGSDGISSGCSDCGTGIESGCGTGIESGCDTGVESSWGTGIESESGCGIGK